MYSLDINFLKDPNRKPEEVITAKAKKTAPTMGSMVPLVGGGIIAAVLIGLPFVGSVWINTKKTETSDEIARLEAEIKKAEEQNTQITQLEGEYTQIKSQTDAFVDIFNKIQPISAILQELIDNVPRGVQIKSIVQSEAEAKAENQSATQKVKIDGIATSYDQANDFLLTLKRSGFFVKDKVFLSNVALTENPEAGSIENIPENLIVEFPQVVQYSIDAEIQVRPASEILDDLTKKGALGLVSRIKILQEKGVITK
jgi:type IV pilus assembly protein PilN